MPIFRPSGLAESISGSVGGLTAVPSFSSGRLRLERPLRRERTVSQRAYRELFRAATAGWSAMSDADRAAWRDWAAVYGQLKDPESVPVPSGFNRWVGQALMRSHAGLAPVALPSVPGIGNADTAFLRFTVNEGADAASAEASVPYPEPAVGPATCLVYVSPRQVLSAMHFRRRWRIAGVLDVTGGGPGADGPAATIPLPEQLPKGYGCWFRTRVVTGAGNTSSEAVWPYLQPPVGQDRAFRTGPLWFIFTPQQIRLTATRLFLDLSSSSTYDTTIEYDLTSGPTATIGGLANAIEADGLWGVWHREKSTAGRPSTDLVPIRRARPIVETQPVLLTLS